MSYISTLYNPPVARPHFKSYYPCTSESTSPSSSDNIDVLNRLKPGQFFKSGPNDPILSYCPIKSDPTFKMPIAGPGRDVTTHIARKVSKMTPFVPVPLVIK